ncbi:hypothetical protein NDU88_007259 [Pleurodeles waltl]|uniref:Uncharacterized protein n=1 Tax=Pleurodeles waltl TaxID=8319 RepID=A0AAV7VQ84_PLEWA|nr:hypothetical protein NDU88_007259 [Pleurodeles waltl]
MPCTCSTDCCRRFTASWQLLQGSRPRGQAAEGAAERIERCVCPGAALFYPSIDRDSCCFLGMLFGIWSVLMAPKPTRTPRSSRARQNPDPVGAKRDKRHPALGSKEHSNPHGKGPQQRIPGTEKDARNSVPTMFASIMKTKQMPLEKVVPDIQSSVPGVDGGQVSVAATSFEVPIFICNAGGTEPASPEIISTRPGNSGEVVAPPLGDEKSFEQELKEGFRELNPGKCNVQSHIQAKDALSQQAEDMVKHLAIFETFTPAPAQRGKEAKPANSDQGLLDTAESFFSLSDQSSDSDLDEEIPLTDSDMEGCSVASI